MKTRGKVSIVIPTYNNIRYLRACLRSIWRETSYPDYEVIVVDNGSGANVRKYLRKEAKRERRLRYVLSSQNLGFPRAVNVGIIAAGVCDYVVLLNDDTIVTSGWLNRFVRYLGDSSVGMIGPVSNASPNPARVEIDSENYWEPSGIADFAKKMSKTYRNQCFDTQMLAMYCVAMRRSVMDEVGLLDEHFGIGMFEDDDYSLRVRNAGYRIVCAKDVFVHHWGMRTLGRMDREEYDQLFAENRKYFEEKWGVIWGEGR